jgi:predicted RNA-binding Zn ribbon-like protein
MPEQYALERTDLVGGHIVLDLVNTVTGRTSRPTDWLESYDRVLEWAALTDAFDASSLRTLHGLTTSERHTARALNRLRDLREAVYEVVFAAIRAKPAPKPAQARLERHWKTAVDAARLTFARGRAELTLDVETSQLDYPRHLLAVAAFDLLRALPLERTRECASPRCTWIFIDSSRGGQRRWCDMATCGNQAKSRRHYERTRSR